MNWLKRIFQKRATVAPESKEFLKARFPADAPMRIREHAELLELRFYAGDEFARHNSSGGLCPCRFCRGVAPWVGGAE